MYCSRELMNCLNQYLHGDSLAVPHKRAIYRVNSSIFTPDSTFRRAMSHKSVTVYG